MEPLLAAYAAASAVAQAAVALAFHRAGPGEGRRGLAALFGLNAGVAAMFAARAVEPSNPLWPAWSAILDAPTTLLVAALALRLAGRWDRRWIPVLFGLWLLHPLGLLANPGNLTGPLGLHAWGFVRLSYAAVVLAAAARLGHAGWEGRVAPWVLAGFGSRALEFAVLDAPFHGRFYPDLSTALATGVPALGMSVAVLTAAVLAVRRRAALPRGAQAAGLVFLAGALFGLGEVLSLGDLIGQPNSPLAGFLAGFTLFVVRPVAVARAFLGPAGALAPLAVFGGAFLTGALATLFGLLFQVSGVAPWALALSVAIPTTAAAHAWSRSKLAHNWPTHVQAAALDRLTAMPVADRAQLGEAAAPLRVLLALRGTEAGAMLYEQECSHAGLAAVAGVHYKKLSATIAKLEALHPHPGGEPLVRDYGAGRSKFYRLTPRGALLAEEVAARFGVEDLGSLALRSALLHRAVMTRARAGDSAR